MELSSLNECQVVQVVRLVRLDTQRLGLRAHQPKKQEGQSQSLEGVNVTGPHKILHTHIHIYAIYDMYVDYIHMYMYRYVRCAADIIDAAQQKVSIGALTSRQRVIHFHSQKDTCIHVRMYE